MIRGISGALMAALLLLVGWGLGFAGWTPAAPFPPADALTCDDAHPCSYAQQHRIVLASYQPMVLAGPEAVATTPPAEVDGDVGELAKQAEEIAATWKGGAKLGAIIMLVAFLIRLTKLAALGAWFKANKLEWIRPLLGCVLAGLTAGAAAAVTGAGLPWAIVAGVLAAVAAPGLHEVVTALTALFKKSTRDKQVAKAAATGDGT